MSLFDVDPVTGFTYAELNGKRIDYDAPKKPSYGELEAENERLKAAAQDYVDCDCYEYRDVLRQILENKS